MPASVPKGPPGMVPGIISLPKIAYDPKMKLRIRKAAINTNLNWFKILFVFSERFQWRILKTLRSFVIRSWYSPNGQSQPQKILPNMIDIPMNRANTIASFSKPDVE